MAAPSSLISIEEYLKTSYHPDVEFIDGRLEEKPLGTWDHSRLQMLIGGWFLRHEREWGVQVVVEVRTQVVGTRVRLPDLVVDWAGPHPQVLETAPLLAIEVLSPSNSYSELRKRAKDYQLMGIKHIWLIDPDTRTAQSCEEAFWVERERLEIAGTSIYLDVPALFSALDSGEAL